MKFKCFLSILIVLFTMGYASAQDELFEQLDTIKSKDKEIEMAAFKGLQICNMQSTKTPLNGEFYTVISHRFGDLTNGINNFFGLDDAVTKIGGIYGVTKWLSFGFSRHTYNKIYELSAKYKMSNQLTNGFPLTIIGYNTMDVNTKLSADEYVNLKSSNRIAFTSQLLVSRKFSESFSFELVPIYIHKNLYDPVTENKDQFVMATGGRYKVSKRLSVNMEYAARINAPETTLYHNPLTVGLDIDTGGHIFQLVFSNSQPMNDVSVFTNSTGNWNGGSIYFGFNMYRVF